MRGVLWNRGLPPVLKRRLKRGFEEGGTFQYLPRRRGILHCILACASGRENRVDPRVSSKRNDRSGGGPFVSSRGGKTT